MGVQPIAVSQSLALVLNSAGDKSGVDFDYLLQTAIRESSLNPEAKASSSSAVGLFQFLDSTWLQVMKQEGPRLGYQEYADAITRDSDGDYVVKDKAKRAEILKLREDPQLAADLAAAFTRSNGAYLEQKFGRMPSPGELYIAHFLGPQGAEKLFQAGLANPDQVAAKLFPRQAKANRAIFYAGDHARTIKEVYRALVAKHDGTPDPSFVAQQLVGAPAVRPPRWPIEELPSRLSLEGPAFDSLFLAERTPGTAQPTFATEAIAAFARIEAPNSSVLGYAPLPAPPPLIAQEGVPILDPVPLPSEDMIPRARVLLSSDPNFGNRLLAQLLGQ